MRAIDAVVAHFNAIGVRYVDVPEWIVDGKPLRVHYKPLTIAERKHVLRDENTDADVLIAKAIDANGEKLFTLADKQLLLLDAVAGVVTRVVTVLLSIPKVEDAEKNSGAIPS
jgi:hypothetical protein